MSTRDRYIGEDQIQVANDAGLPITHIGYSSLATFSRPLSLKIVLHVLRINRYLLSVHKLALDNNAFLEFHPHYFFVKDRATKNILLKGRCKGGLYALPNNRPSQALLSAKITQEQ